VTHANALERRIATVPVGAVFAPAPNPLEDHQAMVAKLEGRSAAADVSRRAPSRT
jgi:hypothetical protein